MFVYYVVANHGPIDQASIMVHTGMNHETPQNTISDLLDDGLIKANTDRKDLRKKVYSLKLVYSSIDTAVRIGFSDLFLIV